MVDLLKKICTRCGDEKEIKFFSKTLKGKYGVHSQCLECRNAYERERYSVGDRAKRLQRGRYTYTKQIWQEYKLTMPQYVEILNKQNNCCAICNRTVELVVDHDHQTKKVRGLLCIKCNTGLGKFNDDFEILLRAIKYLEG